MMAWMTSKDDSEQLFGNSVPESGQAVNLFTELLFGIYLWREGPTVVDFERLYARIREKGVTQKYLCQRAGKGRQYIADARSGNGSISQAALEEFARALDTTVAWLEGESEEKERPREELVDAIILGRNGKTIRRRYPREEMERLNALLDALPHTDEEL